MRLSHKFLILITIGLACSFVGTVGLYTYALSTVERGITQLQSEIVQSEEEVESLDIRYDNLNLSLPFGLRWQNPRIDVLTPDSVLPITISSDFAQFKKTGLFSGRLQVSVGKLKVVSASEAQSLLSNQYKIRSIEVSSVEYQSDFNLLNPKTSVRKIRQNLAQLLKLGETDQFLSLEGAVFFNFDNKQTLSQRFYTEAAGELYRVVLNQDDLQFVAPKFADRLSDGDIQLIAKHPFKAPRLLEIRQETEEKTRELRWGEKDFAEDAYRHVLWSYLLTKEYGKEFAMLVTNAHEYGSYNSEEEMAKDRQNNQVGIAYAEEGLQESKILARIRTDPRVQL